MIKKKQKKNEKKLNISFLKIINRVYYYLKKTGYLAEKKGSLIAAILTIMFSFKKKSDNGFYSLNCLTEFQNSVFVMIFL